jgi:acyl-CoA synthetase (AMP-forming)/AMP-acid ligase II
MNPFVGKTYAESISYIAERHGGRTALIFEGRRHTFADIKREANAASRKLAALGLQPGDTIALWCTNRPEFAWVWLGASQMGLVTVILNTRLKREEFVYQIAQSDSRAVVAPGPGAFRDFLGELADVPPDRFPRLRHVIALDSPGPGRPDAVDWTALPDDGPLPAMETDPGKPALIAYSSGTTAQPKGAVLSHCIWRKAYDGGTYLDLGPDERLFLSVPLFGVLGCLNGLLTFWAHGASIVLEQRFEADSCLRALCDLRCTMMHLLPSMLDRLSVHPDFDPTAFPQLRGGVILSSDPAVMERATRELDAPGFITGYGLTESTGLVARCRWDQPLAVRTACQGWPLPDCHLRIVEPESGQDMPAGEPGEIWIGGYSVMLGYYNKPEETARAITPDGWLRSGDMGYLREDGAVVFLRRLKDGYKHKGFNVSTPEVEAAIQEHPGVAAAAVVGVPDPQAGEIGVAYIVAAEDSDLDEADVLVFLKDRLSSFKLPVHVFVVESFPLTSGTGKVQKFKLREDAIGRLRREAPAAG